MVCIHDQRWLNDDGVQSFRPACVKLPSKAQLGPSYAPKGTMHKKKCLSLGMLVCEVLGLSWRYSAQYYRVNKPWQTEQLGIRHCRLSLVKQAEYHLLISIFGHCFPCGARSGLIS